MTTLLHHGFFWKSPSNFSKSGISTGLIKWPPHLAGLVRIVADLGKNHVTPDRVEHQKRTLPADKRRGLLKDLKLAPAWMYPIFRSLSEEQA